MPVLPGQPQKPLWLDLQPLKAIKQMASKMNKMLFNNCFFIIDTQNKLFCL